MNEEKILKKMLKEFWAKDEEPRKKLRKDFRKQGLKQRYQIMMKYSLMEYKQGFKKAYSEIKDARNQFMKTKGREEMSKYINCLALEVNALVIYLESYIEDEDRLYDFNTNLKEKTEKDEYDDAESILTIFKIFQLTNYANNDYRDSIFKELLNVELYCLLVRDVHLKLRSQIMLDELQDVKYD